MSKAKKVVAVSKAEHCDQLYHDLDTAGGSHKIYRLTNRRHLSTLDIGQVKQVKGGNHQVLRDTPAIYKCWSEYFSQISNKEFPYPPIDSTAHLWPSPADHIS